MSLFRKIKTPVKLGVASVLIAILISQTDIAKIHALLLKTNQWFFILAFLVMSTRIIIVALRWNVLLRPFRCSVSLWRLTRFYFIGRFFSFFLPTTVGGDLVRGYYLHNEGIGIQQAASSIIVERVLGVAATMVLALIGILYGYNLISSHAVRLIVIVPSVMGLTALWLLYVWDPRVSPRIPEEVSGKLQVFIDFVHQIQRYKAYPQNQLYGFGLSVLFQGIGIGATYLIALSLGSTTPLVNFIMFLPIVWLISMLPVSINGLGLREGSFVYLFTSNGMSTEMALAISTLFLFQLAVLAGVGCLFFLCSQKKYKEIKAYPNTL